MSKIIRSILIASLLAAGIILSPSSQSSASAAYCIGIYRIYYNSPGTDTGSNTSLNAEWIQLRNRCSTSRSLTSWTVKDLAGHTYTFGSYTLGGGSYVKVRTGTGTNTATSRYQGRSCTCGTMTRTRHTSTAQLGSRSIRAITTTDPLARSTVDRWFPSTRISTYNSPPSFMQSID